MHAPTLFETPHARLSDPLSSHEAAASVRPASAELIGYICAVIGRFGPLTHDGIAEYVEQSQPNRWTRGTIVTACARADLHVWDYTTNDRGRRVAVWATARPIVRQYVSDDEAF